MNSFCYETIVYLCEAIISGVFLLNLLRPKHNIFMTVILWCQVVFLLMLFTPAFSFFRIIIVAIAELIFVFVMYDDAFKIKIAKFLIKQGLVVLSSFLSFGIYVAIVNNKVTFFNSCTSTNCTYCLLYLLMFSLITSIVYQIVKKGKQIELPWVIATQIIICGGECSAVIAVGLANSGVINSKHSWLIIISVLIMIAANISIGLFASYLLNQVAESKDIDYGKEISNMEYKYYEMSVENDKKIRAIKHDISNQIQTVYSLFKSGEDVKGYEMIDYLKEKYTNVEQIIYCENPVVNIILSNKRREAEEKGIETHFRVKESLESIPITDYDLSTVICNLLDNAIDGCINSAQTHSKLVVELLCKNQYLVIRVLNSCKVSMNVEDTDNIETTKTISQNHGIGMSIIAGIAKKYRGDFVVSARNGIFTATVILSIK